LADPIKIRLPLLLILAASFLYSCSTQKDRWTNVKYHELTTHYNGYFNGNESYKAGVERLEANVDENFDEVLPIYITGDENNAKAIFGDMDRAIQKATKMIEKHSMRIKGEEKNRWIDENYMLIGKARFYRMEYISALDAFNFVYLKFPNDPSYYEAQLWIARTHMAMGNYTSALLSLDNIAGERNTPEELRTEINAFYAQAYYDRGMYEDAIDFMFQSLAQAKDKEKRIRRTFILGQLYEKNGECHKAVPQYGEVVKLNPEYKYEFNAQIRRALCVSERGRNKNAIKDALIKMAEDDKNAEYLDQIYYALGEIAYNEEKTEEAIQYFKASSASSVGNMKQKAMTYMRLAEIFFENRKYVPAQAYYDSTMMVLPREHVDYVEISRLTKNLTELVTHLITIQTQDSLQALARMSESDRNKAIDKMINKIKEDEKRAEREAQRGFNQKMRIEQENRDRGGGGTGGGWYFYNPSTVSFGYSEFTRIWGDRKLEDNWRRRNKLVTSTDVNDAISETDTIWVGDSMMVVDKYDREYYLRFIPLTDSALAVSDSMIQNAYYQVGYIYKEKLNDLLKSADSFESLLKRYPDTPKKLRLYFNLYRVYTSLQFDKEASHYKSLILNEYPNSEYAQVILDPEYFQKKEQEANKVEDYYRDTYTLFTQRKYSSVIKNAEYAIKAYPGHPLLSKFAFLRALSLGSKGEEELIAALEELIANYNGTAEAEEARAMLRYYKADVSESTGESEDSVDDALLAEAEKLYQDGSGKQHFFVLIAPNGSVDFNTLNSFVSDFNRNFFETQNLNVRSLFLDQDNQMISVRTFKDDEIAKNYFTSLSSEPNVQNYLNVEGVHMFLISTENFTAFYQDKRVDVYKAYFNAHYK
jgi:tetratricopeptide (TPR) repeat protein